MKKYRMTYRSEQFVPKLVEVGEMSDNLRTKLIKYKSLMHKAEDRTEEEMIEHAKENKNQVSIIRNFTNK